MLCFQVGFAEAVHAECEQIQALAHSVARKTDRMLRKMGGDQSLPTGLKEKTKGSYAAEWLQYEKFVRRMWSAVVPGKHETWNAFVLWKYLCFRARRCKPTTVFSCLSALAHCGTMHGYVLPTNKFDGNPLMYRQIKNMKREISLRYSAEHGADGATFDVKQSTPLGNGTVALVLSAFSMASKRSFRRLRRADRHHIVASMMQHTCGMRFGHFLSREYRVTSFFQDANGSFRLLTDWHRYSGQRTYCLEFDVLPRWACLRYVVSARDGSTITTLTAATVMQWHFEQLRQAGESLVFAPTKGVPISRQQRKQWLQQTILSALPASDVVTRRRVELVSPHAFRAGLAGDLLRQGVAPQSIAIWCRWWSMRAMRMYADRRELLTDRQSSSFRLIDRSAAH